jgi:hypothetical protein
VPAPKHHCRASAFVLDAGAFVAVERNDRAMLARLRVAQQQGVELRTNAMVLDATVMLLAAPATGF